MHSRPYFTTPILLCLALALVFCPTVPAAGVRLDHGYASYQPPQAQANNGVFPFLTWLRNSAVEFIFGRPASAKPKSAPARGMGAFNPRYSKETVLRFNVSSQEDENALADAADRLFLDVWGFTRNHVDIRIHKNDVTPLLSLLPVSLRGNFSTLIPDLPSAVAATYNRRVKDDTRFDPSSSKTLKPSLIDSAEEFDNVFFRDYQPLHVIHQWMRLLESMFPKIVKLETIGKSFEGREILALRVGNNLYAQDADKNKAPRKTVVINGGLHAREWIATATVNYLVWALITSYDQEPVLTRFLNNYTVVFIPVTNPDGYVYSWDSDRLWRKSRQDTPFNFCHGLDLNHAFDFEWNQDLREPCSEDYGGQKPFEAVEARELSQWAKKQVEENHAQFVGFIDLHSYSQEILYPFEYTCDPEPPNVENLEELAADLAKAIRLSSGEQYDVFSACEGAVLSRHGGRRGRVHGMEPPGGSAMDWFYHEMHARYSYQIKLRDRGSYGFLLPPDAIIPTGKEVFNALKFYADFLGGNNGIERVSSSRPFGPVTAQKPEDVDAEIDEMAELKKRRRKR